LESKGTWLLAFLLRRRRRVQAMSQLTAEERHRSFEHRLVALAVAGALLMAQTARVVSLQGAPALIEWFLPRVGRVGEPFRSPARSRRGAGRRRPSGHPTRGHARSPRRRPRSTTTRRSR